MDTDIKKSSYFESEKSSIAYELEAGLNNEPKISKLRFVLVFSGLILCLFMATLDQTIIITAVGQISAEFNASGDIGFLGSSYLLTMSGFQPMYGIFADIIGHKNVYLIAISMFLVGSLLCGLSSSMFMLIMCRAIQGIGGAGLNTVILIIVTDVVSAKDRAKYQGILGIGVATATVAGPLVGGVLADAGLWRWSFLMNIFIGIAAMVVIIIFFRQDMCRNYRKSDLPITKQLRQVDYGSILLLMPGAICILIALQTGGEMMSWNSPLVLTLFSVGTLALVLFVLSEIYVIKHNPVMPRRMMTTTNIALFVAQFVGGASDYGLLYFVPLHYQIVRGDLAVQSAMELLPFFLAMMVAGLVSGILMTKTGHYRIYMWIGGLLSVIGAALFSTSTVDSNIMHQYVYLAIMGFGFGLCKLTFIVAGQASVPKEDLSLATSHGQFFHILGGAVGISVSSTLFQYNISLGLQDLKEKFHVKLSLKNINIIKHLPNKIKLEVQTVVVQSIDKVYMFAAIAAGITLLTVVFIKHYDLWTPEGEEQDQKQIGKSSSD